MEKGGDGFVDRSKVRILLCDNDEKSSEEVFTLLCKCSYQVTSVKSPRQVIDALNAEGPDIDIILSEVDLPMCKGLKMLKYIMRDKELRRIPVIMMSAQDEVSIVVKCLKFGAADYLVKPLRTNELLNLWTHMWRRRRMLGLAEKNIVNYDFYQLVSDPSDANTNSTTLFSDDTDDKSQKSANPEMCVSTHLENENNAANTPVSVETATEAPSECQPDVPGPSDSESEQISPFPKKSELRIGESSAFFTYVKLSKPNHNSSHENPTQLKTIVENMNIGRQNSQDFPEAHHQSNEYLSSTIPDSFSAERSSTPQIPNSVDPFSQVQLHSRNDSHNDVPSHYPHAAYPFYIPPVMNMYQKNMPDMPGNSSIMPQYNHHIPQCPPHIPGMASYPYYPFGMMPLPHPWPTFGSSSNEGKKPSKVDRREQALIKFRQKRKERCFDKKIRYVNRKKLAERRPRLRGQFVRKVNGVSMDLNGQPRLAEEDDEEEEDYDGEDQDPDQSNFSPDDDASTCLQ